MTRTRTDIHRPSAPEFDPAGYVLLDVYDLHPEDGDQPELAKAVDYHLNLGASWAQPYRDAARCGHCGANLRYVALMYHGATDTMMFVGSTCLTERFADM